MDSIEVKVKGPKHTYDFVNTKLIIGLVGLVMLAGCGPANKASLPNASATSSARANPTTSTTTGAPANKAGDQTLAQSMLLTAVDLPASFEDQGPPSDDNSALDDQIGACVGTPPLKQSASADVNGDSFAVKNSANNETLFQSADVFIGAGVAQNDASGITNSKNFSCLEKLLSTAYAASLTVDSSHAQTTMAPLSGVTSDSEQNAVRITTKVTTSQGVQTLYDDHLVLQHERLEVSLDLDSYNTPPTAGADKALFTALEKHLGAASTSL